jgi:hypothetical protein
MQVRDELEFLQEEINNLYQLVMKYSLFFFSLLLLLLYIISVLILYNGDE